MKLTRSFNRMLAVSLVVASCLLGACASTGPAEDPHALFREHMPSSILVLPPVNEAIDVNATYAWLSVASQPIAEKGFYVFPVAIVDEFMKENGLPQPEDMHATPLNKLGEIFGADAVMYVTIEDYGQKFELIHSRTIIKARADLVDVGTGQSLWRHRVDYSDTNSSNSGDGLLGAIVSAAIAQVGESLTDAAHDALPLANAQLFYGHRDGLLLGPTHPGFDAQMQVAADKQAAAEAKADLAEEAAVAE